MVFYFNYSMKMQELQIQIYCWEGNCVRKKLFLIIDLLFNLIYLCRDSSQKCKLSVNLFSCVVRLMQEIIRIWRRVRWGRNNVKDSPVSQLTKTWPYTMPSELTNMIWAKVVGMKCGAEGWGTLSRIKFTICLNKSKNNFKKKQIRALNPSRLNELNSLFQTISPWDPWIFFSPCA